MLEQQNESENVNETENQEQTWGSRPGKTICLACRKIGRSLDLLARILNLREEPDEKSQHNLGGRLSDGEQEQEKQIWLLLF